MRVKKHNSIEKMMERYGLIMISPWIIGMIVFFIIPIIQSVIFSFSDISIEVGETEVDFVGLKHYTYILFQDPNYLKSLFSEFKNMLISLPFILLMSFVLALLLDGKYKGRIFFRGFYFLPVIIASGSVLQLFLKAASSGATSAAISDTATFGAMIDFDSILESFNLPETVKTYISSALSNIFMLIWQSGIQTILIIAGLQSIPELLYEVAKVEGASKWEELWYITIPMLVRTMMLVIIFTLVELVSSSTNGVITMGYNQMSILQYGRASAILWFYFMIAGLIMALFFLFYNKAFLRRLS